jgi:predicted component of type VI protein secretion system
MAVPTYQLVMRSGPTPGRAFDLNKPLMTIGRDVTNDITISDAEISRKHTRLTAQAGGYLIEDTGSTNGTFVNGQRLMGPHLLRPGELVLLGENVSLSYEPVQFDPDATMAASPAVPPVAPPLSPQPIAPPYAQPAPQYAPPQSQYPPVQPQYGQPVQPVYASPAPAEAYPVEAPAQGVNRTWVMVGCGVLLLLTCVCMIALLAWIDAGGQARWCQFLWFLFSACK